MRSLIGPQFDEALVAAFAAYLTKPDTPPPVPEDDAPIASAPAETMEIDDEEGDPPADNTMEDIATYDMQMDEERAILRDLGEQDIESFFTPAPTLRSKPTTYSTEPARRSLLERISPRPPTRGSKSPSLLDRLSPSKWSDRDRLSPSSGRSGTSSRSGSLSGKIAQILK